MNSSTHVEYAWTPNWNLGTQDSFCFAVGDAEADAERKLGSGERPGSWATASIGALEQGRAFDRRVASETSSLAEVIGFFEATVLGGGSR